jgi:RNA polymerase sigma-70 factor (ECF subfamily)
MQQDELFEQVIGTLGGALDRLVRSHEVDPDKQSDLLQEIHFATWRSLAKFRHQCSLRTWVYRVAHNVAASHVLKHRRANTRQLVRLDDVADEITDHGDAGSSIDRQIILDRLYAVIHQLKAVDREVVLLYLENLDASAIAEITGISAANVATRIHRVKKILATHFREGGHHGR